MKLKMTLLMMYGIVLAALPLTAETEIVGDYTWTYRINGDTAEITEGSSFAAISPNPTGAVAIPSTLGGKPVTSIGEFAFYDCSGLASVTIPDGVTRIGHGAFWDCSRLTSMTIPDGVTSIGDYAFYGCSGMNNFIVGANNLNYNSVNGLLLTKDGKTLIAGINGNVTIPNGVTSIGEGAFGYCRGLTSVTIPDGVTNIGSSAFRNCSSLTSVTIPDSVTSIGSSAFYGCSRLTNVAIGNGVTSIGRAAFEGCSDSLFDTTTILGVKIVDGWAIDHMSSLSSNLDLAGIRGIGYGAFSGCSSLTSVTISDNVTNIEDCAFFNCSSLTSVLIPDSVTRIGEQAFRDCSSLTSMTIPDSVTSIGDAAFSGCSGLMSFVVGDGNASYKSINGLLLSKSGKTLVAVLGKLVNVTIPDGVTCIGNSAFDDCRDLMSVTFPDSVTSIGDYAFSGCRKLASVTIPDGVTSIGEGAFYECYGLTSVTIPNSVTSIGVAAFYQCSGLTSVTIPDGVTSIGNGAFSDCSSLTSMTIPDGVTSIGDAAFHWCSGLKSVAIPDSVMSIGDTAFYHCSKLTSVTIPDSVTRIGRSAFYGCQSLTCVTMSGNCPIVGNDAWFGVADRCIVRLPRGNTTYNVVGGKWQEMTVEYYNEVYSITFVDEMDAENPNAITYTVEDYYDFLPPAPVAGWNFLGWDMPGVYNQTGDITVTAQWARSDRTVTFDIGAHGTRTGGGALTQTVVWGETAESPSITADVGWVFTGWDADISQITESVTVTAQYERAPLSIEAASGLDKVWTTSGNVPWYTEWSDAAHDGVNHLHSGAIGDNQESWIEAYVDGAGTVSFWWKVSSEHYKQYAIDYAVFSVDGQERLRIGGEQDWTNAMVQVEGGGTHVLRWAYVKDDEMSGGEDCAWLDNVVWTPADPLPALDSAAADNDAKAIVAGLSDVRLSEKIGSSAEYAAFRNWVDSSELSHALVKGAPNAWLSYALDAPALMARNAPLASEDIVIESIEPSSAATGAFDLVVDIADAEIGEGARIAEALGVEGAAELSESAFSSEGLSVTLERTADGKAKATVAPDGAPATFFLRVRVK